MIRITDRSMYLPQGDTAKVEFNAENLELEINQTDRLLFLITNRSK